MLPSSAPVRLISLSITNPRASLAAASAVAATAVRRSASSSTSDDHNLQLARTWLAQLHPDTIPKSIGEVTFSRSSGPGGQNVNKVNSKATLKIPLDPLFQHVPSALHAHIRRSRYCAERSNTLIIQADDSRKQADNVHSCYRRLYETLVEAGRTAVPGETSPEQARRVRNLQKSDNERRLKSKKQHSAKKSARRGRPE